MNHVFGPGEGPTRALCSSKLRNEIARIEFAVVTKAECALVWKLFSQCEQWNRYLNAYGKIRWFGERWAPGSRLQIELTHPISAVQDRVITVCNPPRCVAWINHVLGYTMEQWVLFDPHTGGGTRVSTWIEFTGETLHVDGRDIEVIVRDFVAKWYSNFRDECDRIITWA
jgi:hypothetical protein